MSDSAETTSRSVLKRVWLVVAVLAGFGAAFGALLIFGWMIDETHFDRPDPGFDELAARVESSPGVSVDAAERWVEAPTFADPTSWIQLTVDEAHLPDLLAAACASDYPDPVAWSVRVSTGSGGLVSLYTDAEPGDRGGEPCPDFGFDAVGVVGEVGASLPGAELQASIWDDGRFALVVLDDDPGPLSALLPLVDHAEAVRDAAGLDPSRVVEINAAPLSVIIPPDEHDLYRAVLSDLAENHGVVSFWADGGGTPVDGIDKLQIAAADHEHAAIERVIRESGLHIADFPVRFLPPRP